MERWIALSDAAARDPDLVGAKAAGLARARAAGLPALGGAVLPLAASTPAVRAGAEALRRAGPARAYLEAMAARGDAIGPPPNAGDGPWVVRSSTTLDSDGRWSGAFASYLEVSVEDLAAAVRGCWASAVGRDAVARGDAVGLDVGSIRVGVVVQPSVRCRAGGTARVAPDASVTVVASAEGPAGVVASGLGHDVVVDADGRGRGSVPDGVRRRDVEQAAALARSAAALTGASSIEWGAVDGDVLLFQLGPAPATPARKPRSARGPLPARAERLARLVATFPGPVGLELVLPWALGADGVPRAGPPASGRGREALDEVRGVAAALAGEVWDTDPSEASARTEEVARLLWSGRFNDAARRLSRLRPPDPLRAGRVLAGLAAIADRLVFEGRLPAAPLVWRLTPDELARALDGAPAPVRRGPDRWEPFVAEVVMARGVGVAGTIVSPGIGAGPSHVVGRLSAAIRPAPRGVLVADRPRPQLAPLLWHSAGLVTIRGSVGAHLFEVARSLGVPTVTEAGLTHVEDGALVAVDGDGGIVSFLTGSDARAKVPRDDRPVPDRADSSGKGGR